MSKQKKGKAQSQQPARKRVDPAEQPQLDDEALESVAGGCQTGCTLTKSVCIDLITNDQGTWVPPTFD